MKMKSSSCENNLIVPANFYSEESEKTKLNWFCYEYALELQTFFNQKLKRKLLKKNINKNGIADFCIYHSKFMKGPILDRLSGKNNDLEITYHPIEKFFPFIGDKLVDEILTIVGKAWDSQTEVCVQCPTRCISEKTKVAPMFDDPYYKV
ncbi:MAG: hypothetical protein K8F52_04520 [Candidatus Scalindua rubra]|uniref:Uncharacterized protein n=1 Tax=Candidatus Scalindua brodae TaxID=237368 RepID=A0A0B0EKF6_9BACT|nr:MAG: hypothetical protein SCABRO_01180 [Candidatus Scalindua brodae]MBZ0107910.1 hypothetical protein [Candidatus Scalindua rubra]TWU29001.1 hypothetical protein S225a_26390 [Candidatus Brocadiaceae bacterium S225]